MSWWNFKKEEPQTEVPEVKVEELPNYEDTGVTKELTPASPDFLNPKKSEPFFVRLDKFQDARSNLSEIGKRIEEMELVLEKLSEVKLKEDEEIDSWKEEMKKIRQNLSSIDKSLFDKVQF